MFSHVPGPMWNDRYESLRAAWLASTAGWGQVLFLRQGMVAWMKAWPVESVSPTRGCDAQQAVAVGELTSELERQVTAELASIILHQHDDSPEEIAA